MHDSISETALCGFAPIVVFLISTPVGIDMQWPWLTKSDGSRLGGIQMVG